MLSLVSGPGDVTLHVQNRLLRPGSEPEGSIVSLLIEHVLAHFGFCLVYFGCLRCDQYQISLSGVHASIIDVVLSIWRVVLGDPSSHQGHLRPSWHARVHSGGRLTACVADATCVHSVCVCTCAPWRQACTPIAATVHMRRVL